MKRTGFTLIELLMTAVIFTVVIMVVVGAGNNVQRRIQVTETVQIHETLSKAILAYDKETGVCPSNRAAQDSSVSLLVALEESTASQQQLQWLPRDAIAMNDRGQRQLVDGYRLPIRYQPRGGLGGNCPRFVSLGCDPNDASDDLMTDVLIPWKGRSQ
jgi:prepilin-type N-terminal cleavage/methylation domain-containing protein